MVTVEAGTTIEDALTTLLAKGFSRLPVYKDQPDDLVGIAYLKDLARKVQEGKGKNTVRRIAREAKFVPEQVRVADLLRNMQHEKFHMAVVVDEYGGVAGLVTLEDLLEEIVGEITDEYDPDTPDVEHLDDGSMRVPGRLPIDDVNEILGVELPDDEWDTVGGLMFNLLGHVPNPGESVTCQGVVLRAEKVARNRIVSVLIQPPPTEAPGPAATAVAE
jgi:CBS domain containing-hemolysin-like protein